MSSESSMTPITANDNNPELAVKPLGGAGGVSSGMKAGFEDGVSSIDAISRDIPAQMSTGDGLRKTLSEESAGSKAGKNFKFLG